METFEDGRREKRIAKIFASFQFMFCYSSFDLVNRGSCPFLTITTSAISARSPLKAAQYLKLSQSALSSATAKLRGKLGATVV